MRRSHWRESCVTLTPRYVTLELQLGQQKTLTHSLPTERVPPPKGDNGGSAAIQTTTRCAEQSPRLQFSQSLNIRLKRRSFSCKQEFLSDDALAACWMTCRHATVWLRSYREAKHTCVCGVVLIFWNACARCVMMARWFYYQHRAINYTATGFFYCV